MKSINFSKVFYCAIIVFISLLAGCESGKMVARHSPSPNPQCEFGILTEGYYSCSGQLKLNQNLFEVLKDYGVTYQQVLEIAEASKPVLDIRRMVAGKPYTIISETSDDPKALYFVYEKDPINYIVYDLRDKVKVKAAKKPVVTKTKAASGIIYSSLYQTMVDADLPFQLAIDLSRIYAWSVDFYRIQKGDRFRVVYEEKYVDGERVALGDIHAAQFYYGGKELYAFNYDGMENGGYYDEDGFSMRKAFLQAPLEYSRISSGFSRRRFHPIYKRYTTHLGIDYAAPYGTPIQAVGDGVIIKARYSGGNGNYIKIRHNDVYSTQYLHMSKFGEGIKEGVFVEQGQTIGYIGSTGLSTGPHVCYRFWKNGQQVNPLTEIIPPADPLDSLSLPAFYQHRDSLMEKLHELKFDHEGGIPTEEEGPEA